MLNEPQLQALLADLVHGQLPAVELERVVAEAATDDDGAEMLRITLVVSQDSAEAMTGDEALDLLVRIRNELQQKGDDRFPVVSYATEDELQEAGPAAAPEPEHDDEG